jgi:hypothetical protein
LADVGSAAREQLVNARSFAWCWSEQSPDALNVFSLAESARDDDRDVGVRNIEAFVEDPSRHERPELPLPESSDRFGSFRRSDVTRQRHDEVLTRNAVGSLVVRREDEDSRIAMMFKELRDGSTLALRIRQDAL